jgi:hypothetical protein
MNEWSNYERSKEILPTHTTTAAAAAKIEKWFYNL